MTSNSITLLLLIVTLLAGCGSSGGGSSAPAPILVSISVTPANESIALGTTQKFIATGTFSNNTTQNLTGAVTWSSTSTSVATISNMAGFNGLSTLVSTGTTTITAKSGNVSGSTTLTVVGGTAAAINVMPFTVNGSLCSSITSAGFFNKPCVSVTICTPGSITACQTIYDVLLDTGSYGLRIFQQVLTFSLQTIASGTGSLTSCAQFADGSSDWGPVELAGVILGNEPEINVPIQVIDATFATVPASCGTPDLNPTDAGFSGILGVGVFDQDCGSTCVSSNTVGIYYTCSGTNCTPTTVPLSNQVSNPVVSLPTDSNGVIVQLPAVPSSGLLSVNGNLVLGIDTRTNNASSGATMYSVDNVTGEKDYGEILTVFNGISYGSILDSGSNGLFFAASSSQLPRCGDNPD